ncbi:hypothetical protein BJAS_P3885 [Bathymodiolus japonicus methanotrophic gill symbiont]|nr:hypothetical protein BJAS_P3885 [Bathymodiolus japonicus methanotrophic gill symbiont]
MGGSSNRDGLTDQQGRILSIYLHIITGLSHDHRAKESLVVAFINQTNLDNIPDKASIIDAFFTFAQAEQQREAQARY